MTPPFAGHKAIPPVFSAARFRRRFLGLVLLTWTLPPLLGLAFLVYLGMFTLPQVGVILSTPLQPIFIVTSLSIALLVLLRFQRPIHAFLRDPSTGNASIAATRLRFFPLVFWGVFLAYLLAAPSSVILSAEVHAGFEATPADWLRIHLVAVAVSIIVGLPIFFLFLDLFGRVAACLPLDRPQVSIRAKVLLIGALTPLLIDTLLVLYFWTRTGYLTRETFVVWLVLELLAIAGALMFARSFGQSLRPLQATTGASAVGEPLDAAALAPQSTDELGVIAAGYRRLLGELQAREQISKIGTQLLSGSWNAQAMEQTVASVLEQVRLSIGEDMAFLIVHDAATDRLLGVAQTGSGYDAGGHFQLSLAEPSIAVHVFHNGQTLAITDASGDPRVSARMVERFGVKATLATPIFIEGRPAGVLMTVNQQQPRAYAPREIALLESFAAEAALALHTQALYEQSARAREALEEREQRLSLLLRSTGEAIFAVDLDGRCTFVNPACVRMLGYDHEGELLGEVMHHLMHHTHPDGRPYPKEHCLVGRAMRAGAGTHSDEEVHWRKDGTAFPVEYWSQPIVESGEVIGAAVTFVDITERKRQEEHVRRLSEYNRLLLESTGEGIFGVDGDLVCTFANSAAATMLGYRAEDLVGQPIIRLLHNQFESGAPRAEHESFIYQTVITGQAFRSDTEVLWDREGRAVPVNVSASPLIEDEQVAGAVVVFRDVTEARALARKMDFLASHDPLTGLVNRRDFELRLQNALESARSDQAEHVLCYLDLDQFKIVNDTCGHVAGDELLRQLTTVLKQHIRKADTLARLGGDEFGVLYERCPLARAQELAGELLSLVQEFRFVWEDKTFAVGVSIGMVQIDAYTESAAAALSAADAACYVAKDSGRNRLHVFQHDDAKLARRKGEMQWVSRIHEALDQDHFTLHFQPIVPVSGPQDYFGVEVLLRMQDSEAGLVPPGAFIPAAERYDLMAAIDRWVFDHTLTLLENECHWLPRLSSVSINLSGYSVGQSEFLDYVTERVRGSTVSPEKICFEITETAAVAELARAVEFIRNMKDLGCHFALDDFGSGMSSFAYLKNLPVDYLKIDGHFIRDMASDVVDRAMVQSIAQLAQVMGIGTIAEFVETSALLRDLEGMGVDFAQGYGIARPMPWEELLGFWQEASGEYRRPDFVNDA